MKQCKYLTKIHNETKQEPIIVLEYSILTDATWFTSLLQNVGIPFPEEDYDI